MQNKDSSIKIKLFYLSCWVFKCSIVLGKLLIPRILRACIYANFGWCRISLYFVGIILEKISSKYKTRFWTEVALQRTDTSLYRTKKTSYLTVIALQGVVNRLSFPPICSGWRVHARVGRYLLFLSVAGNFSWDEHWQCQCRGGWKVRG